MTPTVDELRDEIRQSVGRHDRLESTAFTKEALAAICAAVDEEIERTRLPPKAQMRADILSAIREDDVDSAEVERPFRKAELEAVARALEQR